MNLGSFWWQYIIAVVPLIFATVLFCLSEIETVFICKDHITFSK